MKTNYLYIFLFACLALTSCKINFAFNGAAIDYTKVHSIAISDFPNHAALVNPSLSNDLTEGIRDIFIRQTRLTVQNQAGDLELEGEITNYTLTPMAISADSYAAETKLTVMVKVVFTDNVNPEASFEKVYSAFQTFDSNQLITDVQDELCAAIITEIAESIYNDTVAKW